MHEKKDKKYFYSQNLFQLKESFQVPSTRKGEWRISVEGTKKEQEEFACLLIHPARCGGEQRRKEGGVAEGSVFKFEFDLEFGERAKNIEVETASYVVKSPKVRPIDQRLKDQRPKTHQTSSCTEREVWEEQRRREVGAAASIAKSLKARPKDQRPKTRDPPDFLVHRARSGRRAKTKRRGRGGIVVKSSKVNPKTKDPKRPKTKDPKNKDPKNKDPKTKDPKAKCQGEGHGGLLFHDSKTKVEKDSDAGLQLKGEEAESDAPSVAEQMPKEGGALVEEIVPGRSAAEEQSAKPRVGRKEQGHNGK
eukprot:CAMPEP_0171902552 /NCGR_PEP_ID=MMETSP0993-20121228/1857_1 /TAXON_ID=483369 /ORGANISM="non described non described, Strain CCMP2098" /LENGTH=305 /DNA_ID=CAMNT_0012532141 /DNA_START=194 /DNA_END=1111 /DNA_ORIENTATION=-